MNSATIISLVCSVVATCLVVFHGWLYALRAQDRANLYIAITGAGIAGATTATAFLYGSHAVESSEALQRVVLVCSALVVLGFYHYTFAYFGIVDPRTKRIVTVLTGALALIGALPDVVFSGEVVDRHNAFFGLDYVEAGLSHVGWVFVAAFVPVALLFVRIFLHHLDRRDPNRRALVVALSIWIASMVNDIFVALDLYPGLALLPVGYSAFLITLSAIQIRQIVILMEGLQDSRDRLGEVVDLRTAELRDKEIQIAHGAQMATIGVLAANLAHEINNPIAYVASNLNRVAESWLRPDDPEELEEMLAECEEGIGRVRSMVSTLLALARRSDGVSQPVDLHAVLDSILPIVRREAESRARLECDLAPSASVSGDSRLLGHVVLSLVTRALRSIPDGEAERNRVLVQTRLEEESVILRVRDTGPPLSPEQLEHMFDPLVASGGRPAGEGLGLAVPRQIVERHWGEIDVNSSADGTTVTVRLPLLV